MSHDAMVDLEPRTGDVLLVERRGDSMQHPIPWLIRHGTRSAYSHVILVVAPGLYAMANPAPELDSRAASRGDIQQLSAAELWQPLDDVDVLTLLRPRGPAADERLLRRAVDRRRARAARHRPGGARPGEVVFSMGAVIGLAALRVLQSVRPMVGCTCGYRRLQAAMFFALTDGDERLYCSEFVYRCLEEAGEQIELPVHPIIDTRDFPRAVVPYESAPGAPAAELGWLLLVRAYFESHWIELQTALGYDADAQLTIEEVWTDVVAAYLSRAVPDRLETADFFMPADFAASRSFCHLATRTRSQDAWRPLSRAGCLQAVP